MTETPPPPQSRLSLYGVADALQTFGLALLSPLALPGLMRDAEGAPGLPRWSRLTPRERWALVALPMVVTLILILGGLLITARLVAVVFFPGDLGAEALWAETRTSLFVIAAALGVPLVLWRAALATRQTMVQQDSHFTGQYARAVEMLGADKDARMQGDDERRREPNIEVRLGAIYALERISKQSDADYLPIMDVLCAYVRQNAEVLGEPPDDLPEPPDEETAEERAARLEATKARVAEIRAWAERLRAAAKAPGRASAERPDLSAALDVLARRAPARRALEFEGMEVQPPDPPALDLPERPDPCPPEEAARRLAASKAHVQPEWNRHGPGALALWARATWRPVLTGAALQGADRPGNAAAPRLDLRRADARGARMQGADLSEARMEGANLSEAQMEGADFFRARIEGAFLSGARMEGADLSDAHMEGAFLSGARMSGAFLSGARMEGADLSEAGMEGAFLRPARMEGAFLSGARMEGALLSGARMEGADLSWARIEGADLSEARMEGADLSAARMEGADLSEARFNSADVSSATFTRSLLTSAEFTDAENLTFDQLASAFGDAATTLPEMVGEMTGAAAREALERDHGWSAEALAWDGALAAYRA